ncbi:MAG: hypothetical protein PUF65_05115 [Lachnospiraceae bacterium]|nr:hypothetical protein [Lachnospiraceae bacterium]
MVKLQHVSFKDWNPVGKPRKKSKGKNGDLLGSVKNRTLKDAGLNAKSTSIDKEPFGIAATLELTNVYVKDKNCINQCGVYKESNSQNNKS